MCTLWSRHACSPHNQTLNQSWSPQPCNGDNSNIDNGNSNDNPRHQYIMAMMAMATWVKSPCLTRWRGPPESPLELELDRGCDIKREGLFVWMANGYLLLLVIVGFFCSYNLILLVVYLASGPSVQSRYAQNLIGRFERNKKVDVSPFLWQQLDIVRRMSSCRWWLHQPASEILKIHG